MNCRILGSQPRSLFSPIAAVMLLAIALVPAFAISTYAQSSELSLADILIALRSKKAPLTERNKLLTDAVATRGTTFSITPEIEKELSATGADLSLIESIRTKSRVSRMSGSEIALADEQETGLSPEADPRSDSAAFEKLGDESRATGNMDAALASYTKAIETNEENTTALYSRGKLYVEKGAFTLAISDLSRLIDLRPQDPDSYLLRADANEKKGNIDQAVADLRKVLELDPANIQSQTGIARLRPVPATPPETIDAKTPPVAVPEPVIRPDVLEMGQLDESRAVRMAKPLYSQTAKMARASGIVIVEVELDDEGNVTSAKAKSGNSFLKQSAEDAAKRSKFKPAMFGETAVKGRGVITYNFVPTW